MINKPQTKFRFWAKVMVEFDIETGRTELVRGFVHPAKDMTMSDNQTQIKKKPKAELSNESKVRVL